MISQKDITDDQMFAHSIASTTGEHARMIAIGIAVQALFVAGFPRTARALIEAMITDPADSVEATP